MSDEPVIRPAMAGDLPHFFEAPPQQTIRAWVVDYKGKPACLAGVCRLNRYTVLAFSEIAPGVDAPKLTVWRTALKLFEHIKNTGLDVIADPDCNIEGAARFLKRLGFHEVGEGLYKWEH